MSYREVAAYAASRVGVEPGSLRFTGLGALAPAAGGRWISMDVPPLGMRPVLDRLQLCAACGSPSRGLMTQYLDSVPCVVRLPGPC